MDYGLIRIFFSGVITAFPPQPADGALNDHLCEPAQELALCETNTIREKR